MHGINKWCVTGTPIQNSINDVYSYIKFLNYDPWDTYAFWRRAIADNFEKGKEFAVNLLKKILQPLILRRTKTSKCQGKIIVELPEKIIHNINLDFSKDELII